MTQCATEGVYQTCNTDAVCMTEVRKRNHKVYRVNLRCKARVACHDQRKQNYEGHWKHRQCRPEIIKGPSVCRQCCETDKCTNDFNPVTFAEWTTGPL